MSSATEHKAAEKKEKPASRGELIFDWLVYGGIGGVAVFVATIPIAFWAKYGKGAERFEAATEWMVKKGLSRQRAEQVMNTTATMQGGNVMILPVKWAEDNKVEIVTKINDMLGEKTDLAQLEAEDKQTWGSILKARVVAWLTVFTSFEVTAQVLGGDKLNKFEEGFSKMACNALGKSTHIAGKETRAFKYGKIAALDVFATTAASILLYFGSRFFAKFDKEKPQEEAEAQIAPPVDAVHATVSESASKTVQNILKTKAPGTSFRETLASKQAEPALTLGA